MVETWEENGEKRSLNTSTHYQSVTYVVRDQRVSVWRTLFLARPGGPERGEGRPEAP
jgi:hypothetical protein